MNNGFEVYKTYLALKLHFTTNSYDFHKYGGKTQAKLDTFTRRNDRYFFHKISQKYNEQEVLDFFVSNFLHDQKGWIGNLVDKEGDEIYLKWQKYKGNLKYNFRSDCGHIHLDFAKSGLSFDDGLRADNGQHPRLLRLFLQKKIELQTLGIINDILGFSKKWDKEIKETFVWPEIHTKLEKMKPFLKYNPTETRLIMKEVFL